MGEAQKAKKAVIAALGDNIDEGMDGWMVWSHDNRHFTFWFRFEGDCFRIAHAVAGQPHFEYKLVYSIHSLVEEAIKSATIVRLGLDKS